ncbi:1-phosphatidylinositol 4,5-bisphosphate phosphodiesterase-like, partial [Aphis craccivora]
MNFPTPTKVRDLRKFLGVCNWYSQFVDNYADTTAPLTDRLKQGTKWSWNEAEQAAFIKIKHDSPKLSTPDYGKPFCLQTDASEIGAGAVLFQRDDRPEERRIIAYASKKFSDTQTRYAAVESECLAIIWATDNAHLALPSQKHQLIINQVGTKTRQPGLQNHTRARRTERGVGHAVAQPSPRTPVDEDHLDERLVGAPTTQITTTISTPADNLFATTEPGNVANEPHITHAMLVTWQANEPDTRDIVKNGTPDTPAHNTRRAASKTFKNQIRGYRRSPANKVARPHTRHHTSDKNTEPNHPGWKETYRAIKQRFYWKGQKNDIRLYVKSCHICACTKPLNKRADDPMTARRRRHPWEVISIDLMVDGPRHTPLWNSHNKNNNRNARTRVFYTLRIPPYVPKRQRSPIRSKRFAQRDRALGSGLQPIRHRSSMDNRQRSATPLQQAAELLERSQQILRAASAETPPATTAARVRRIPLDQLLRDPILWAAYSRGWDDRTTVFWRAADVPPAKTHRSWSPRQPVQPAGTPRPPPIPPSTRMFHPPPLPLMATTVQRPSTANQPAQTTPRPPTTSRSTNNRATAPTTTAESRNARQRRN